MFAPVNDAFALSTEVPSGDALTQILLHHVITASNILLADISNGMTSPAKWQGDALMFNRLGSLVGITDGAGTQDPR